MIISMPAQKIHRLLPSSFSTIVAYTYMRSYVRFSVSGFFGVMVSAKVSA